MNGDTHITREELIDLALDALVEDRVEPVLDHLATCDACAKRSSAIARAATLFDGWRERIHVDEAPDAVWRTRLTDGITRLTVRLGDQPPIAALLRRIAGSPAANVDAALKVVIDAAASRFEVALAALESFAAPPVTLHDVTPGAVRGADRPAAGTTKTVMIAGSSLPGMRVVVEPDTREIVVEFLPPGAPAAALLLSLDAAQPPLIATLESLSSALVRARFANVPDGEHLLVVYLDR